MTVLQVDHLGFGYGADLVFEDVSFSLGQGERMALVAPNGQGKTTLLKLIAGELHTDEGRILLPKNVRISFLHQSHEPDATKTVLDILLQPFEQAQRARTALTEAENLAASGDSKALEQLMLAQDHYSAVGADALEREVSMLAQKIGFSDSDLSRRVASLSGGERGRLQLAAVLASKPDLLLLDEPTNHLDLETVEWLEEHLRKFPGAIIVVSHDRVFLDATCLKTAELGMFRFRLYHCKYSDYVLQREADLERERTLVLQQKEEIARTEEFIRRNIAGQGTNQAKSRRKMLAKLERLDNPEDIWADAKKLGLRFSPSKRSGEIVVEAKNLTSVRGGRQLFQNVNLLVKRLDRVAIVGPNGAGKTTLLLRLAGNYAPRTRVTNSIDENSLDHGEVREGSNLQAGYFDQHLEALDPNRSCVEEIRLVKPEMVVDAIRQYLSRFRFWGDDPFRAVRTLSGGERTRLALAKLLLVPRNVLFLDEPTNHLDIPACEILEEALRHFEGTVIFVSHDRYFLQRVATRVVHLENASLTVYSGNYDDYLHQKDKKNREIVTADTSVTKKQQSATSDKKSLKEQPNTNVNNDKNAKKNSYEVTKKSAKEVERRNRKVAELEKTIGTLEQKLQSLRTTLALAPSGDWERVAQLAEQEQSLVRELDQRTEEWMQLSEET